MDTLEWINGAPAADAARWLLACCGSVRWAGRMLTLRPFAGAEAIQRAAREVWWSLGSGDWKEAFAAHPKIGERTGDATAASEQAGVRGAPPDVLSMLADANRRYEEKFGYIFIVCASGKSADEMLSLIRERLQNDPAREIQIAAEEQAKITALRLANAVKT